jgi:hypothetical protein
MLRLAVIYCSAQRVRMLRPLLPLLPPNTKYRRSCGRAAPPKLFVLRIVQFVDSEIGSLHDFFVQGQLNWVFRALAFYVPAKHAEHTAVLTNAAGTWFITTSVTNNVQFDSAGVDCGVPSAECISCALLSRLTRLFTDEQDLFSGFRRSLFARVSVQTM